MSWVIFEGILNVDRKVPTKASFGKMLGCRPDRSTGITEGDLGLKKTITL